MANRTFPPVYRLLSTVTTSATFLRLLRNVTMNDDVPGTGTNHTDRRMNDVGNR